MATLEIITQKSMALVDGETLEDLATLQAMHSWLIGLVYKERKYNRHTPELGWPIWFGRAVRDLEKTEIAIDRIQKTISKHISIQFN